MINIKKLLESKRVEITFADINVDKHFVKKFRIDNDLTQVALANVLGVTKKTVEKWEQGVNNINGSSAVLLKLLNDNPELINQLYRVKVGVKGKHDEEEYQCIASKVISATPKTTKIPMISFPIAAMF